ncbi:MAG: cadherin-like beta sandwich domain-containing protein [Lachnospiraceae bacterium]|nr:cadherin-like beta sandwich domain-containing protein [Lachnospiraceae bacterium]
MKQGRNRIRTVWQRLATVFCLFLVIGLCLTAGRLAGSGLLVQAASASISIETEETTIQVGDIITVRLVIESADRLGDFEAFLTYQASVLEFEEAEAPATGGDGTIRISDIEPMERTRKRTYELMFRAVGIGGCEIAIQNKAHVYADDGGKEMSVSSNTLSIQVTSSDQASSETKLQDLKVSPGSLTPEFSAETESYEVEVEDVTSLVISAVPEDTKATVAVQGNEEFSDGENLVEITVTAENADSRVYRIHVFKNVSREDDTSTPGEEEPDNTEEEESEENEESGFSLKERGDSVELSGQYRYLVSKAPQTAVAGLPEGYTPYNLMLYGKRIPAYKEASSDQTETGEPSNVLVYVEGSMGEDGEILRGNAGFYEFDIKSKTMEKIRFRSIEKEVESWKEVDTEAPWILYIIIAGLIALCTILGIALVQVGKKYYEAKQNTSLNNIRQRRR